MNANTTTLATKQMTPGDLELTYADFEVAKTMMEASVHFFDEIRAWLNISGHRDAKLIVAELNKGDSILSESKFRMETGMQKLSTYVEQAYDEKAARA